MEIAFTEKTGGIGNDHEIFLGNEFIGNQTGLELFIMGESRFIILTCIACRKWTI